MGGRAVSSFRGAIQKFVADISPWFIREKNRGAVVQAGALALDDTITMLDQGLRLGQPLDCESSALPIISADRGIRIYETEPEASKRTRLSRWWQLHRRRGTHRGEMENLAPFFLPARPLMRIVHQNGGGDIATWHTLNQDETYTVHQQSPSNWDWDGVPAAWARWWAIIYREPLIGWLEAATYDDPDVEFDDGTLWDGGPSETQIRDIVEALQEAQAGHSHLWGVIVSDDETSFDPTAAAVTDADGWTSLPTGNWWVAADAITGLPTRPPYASFIFEQGKAVVP